MNTKLSSREREQLEHCEAIIELGLSAWHDVGQALEIVKDGKLYRETSRTFEQYCSKRWGIKRAHAYRLIVAAEVVRDLSPMGDKSSPIGDIPSSERVARPLGRLPDAESRRSVWAQAIDKTEGDPKAKDLEALVIKAMAKLPPPPPQSTPAEKVQREETRAKTVAGAIRFSKTEARGKARKTALKLLRWCAISGEVPEDVVDEMRQQMQARAKNQASKKSQARTIQAAARVSMN